MAAARKLSEKEIREIVASRAAGESFSSIGRRLGYPHSTIINGHERELERQAEELPRKATNGDLDLPAARMMLIGLGT